MVNCLAMVDDYLHKALSLQRIGDHKGAEKALTVLLEKAPNDPDALHLLGLSLHAQGHSRKAAEKIALAISILPGEAMFHTHAGVVAVSMGDLDLAAKQYEAAIDCDPKYIDAYANYGALLEASGFCEDALTVLNQGLALDKTSVGILVNRGKVLAKLGRFTEAEASYRGALEVDPDVAEAYNNLGNLLKRGKRYEEAATAFEAALTVRPGFLEAQYNKALALAGAGNVDVADQILEELIAEQPEPHFFIARAGLMEAVPYSSKKMAYWRQRFEEGFDVMHANRLQYNGDPLAVPVMSFYLAYHGQNDRPLMEKLCKFWRGACPSLNFVSSFELIKAPKRRVGFFSRFFKRHAVGFTIEGLLEGLAEKASDDIEIVIISLAGDEDDDWDNLNLKAAHVLTVPHDLTTAQNAISELGLDILIYADIGMDPFSYYLSFSRLAPIQCVFWGHPVTSGVDTLDFYISSDIAEPCAAQEHYTERLVRLGGVQTCYHRPKLASSFSRQKVGLPENKTLYMCPQSLFKIHPDMDPYLAKLIKSDNDGRLVIFEGDPPILTDKLLKRWQPFFDDVFDHVIVLKRTDWNRFLSILSLADVILDTWPFGGGNTNYQAFGFGLPVITLPGKFIRGLGANALYQHMGIKDCIAESPEDYVKKALKLGQNLDFRLKVSSRILKQSGLIFDDSTVIEELIKFLRTVQFND